MSVSERIFPELLRQHDGLMRATREGAQMDNPEAELDATVLVRIRELNAQVEKLADANDDLSAKLLELTNRFETLVQYLHHASSI